MLAGHAALLGDGRAAGRAVQFDLESTGAAVRRAQLMAGLVELFGEWLDRGLEVGEMVFVRVEIGLALGAFGLGRGVLAFCLLGAAAEFDSAATPRRGRGLGGGGPG